MSMCAGTPVRPRRNLLFRDFLRANAAARDAWSDFKQRLALITPDVYLYGQAKAGPTEILMIAAESWHPIAAGPFHCCTRFRSAGRDVLFCMMSGSLGLPRSGHYSPESCLSVGLSKLPTTDHARFGSTVTNPARMSASPPVTANDRPDQARNAAREIAVAALGRDPAPWPPLRAAPITSTSTPMSS